MRRALLRLYWRHYLQRAERAIAAERARRAAFPRTLAGLMDARRRALLELDRVRRA